VYCLRHDTVLIIFGQYGVAIVNVGYMPTVVNEATVKYNTKSAEKLAYRQGRLSQWARWARAQGPQASGGPQTAHALVFIS